MAKFRYEARDNYGLKKEGFIEADSIIVAEEELLKLGYQDIKLFLEKKREEIKKGISIFKPKVKENDLAIFTRQLGAMINAGIGIAQALEILSEQLPNKTLSEALKKVTDDVLAGTSLAKAMEKHKKVFPEFLINLVAAAEESGKLDIVLQRATIYYEKIAAIKRKIMSASWYPTAVVVIATIIVIGLLTFVVPTFAQIYESFGGELPLPTQILINISNALKNSILYVIGFIILFFLLNSYFYRTEQGKRFYHRLFLKLPLLGKIFHKGALAKFARTLATLITGGVPIIRALEISSTVASNVIIEDSINKSKLDVERGKEISKSLDAKLFPPIFLAMVNVGENTGRLDEMLDTIASFYEDEIDREVDALISLIEPLLMVVIGGIVGLILIALYLPIFKMGELIK